MKIKLNQDFGCLVPIHGYELDPTQKYVINIANELEQQAAILSAVQIMGLPALEDYYTWLREHGFSARTPNPTNKSVAPFFGVAPLWKTSRSQGIVVKSEQDDDYYIVMECSRDNTGFKYSQIILTLGGCM